MSKGKRPINVSVEPRKNESIERALKRFSRKVKKEKILETVRDRMYYVKPSEAKRKQNKRRKAILDKLKRERDTIQQKPGELSYGRWWRFQT